MMRLIVALALALGAAIGLEKGQSVSDECRLVGDSDATEEKYTPGEPVQGDFQSLASEFLNDYCLECHDDSIAEGNLTLESLGPVDETNAVIWKSVWAQVTLQEMPPKDGYLPEVIERLRFSDWIVSELQRVMKDQGGFHDHRDPQKANFVDHDLLFGKLPEGIELAPTSSPARIWRVTPQEHITRLNELINNEPAFNPQKPGVRTRGDAVPTNHGGELKLYFGTDRITRWQGGTVAYATAVKSLPAVLSSHRKHGLKNYPGFYSVNSAEATQILGEAEDILRYMAYGPLSIANPEQITDDPKSYKTEGDLRGLPTSLVYNTKIVRPMTPVYDLANADDASDPLIQNAVSYLFEALTFRPPTKEENLAYSEIVKDTIEKVGKEDGIFMGLSAIFLDRDALFRPELAERQQPDDHGRVMLRDWELGLALNHALGYIKPDSELRKAIVEGRMRTKEDVRRELTRMLEDDGFRKPRLLQFFRDYFDHDLAGYICKDTNALNQSGAPGNKHYRAMFDGLASTDRLIELILEQDRDVLYELLTTRKVVATNVDQIYFGRKLDRDETKRARLDRNQLMAELIEQDKAKRQELQRQVDELQAKLDETPDSKRLSKALSRLKKQLDGIEKRIKNRRKPPRDSNISVDEAELDGESIFARVSRRSFGNGSLKPERKLATAPEGERLGILTHPSWLVSHSDATDNHAILRGRWIRERLLGGGIPDVPITVDAMLPDEPGTTLRERMRVTRENYCWNCHQKMDPLGLPFEIYNHVGLYRTKELEKPVDASGEIIDSGDPELDGPVNNALEMIEKLANSERVEQVFVRHAFRFWMGRNETLNDGPVLQAAHKAYRENGGSMKAMLISLLTSDAFMYRKVD